MSIESPGQPDQLSHPAPPALDAPPAASAAPTPVAQAPKLSVTWTGMVMVLGAIIAAVGTFLPFEKLVFFNDGAYVGFYQFKGIGSHTSAGLDVDDALQPGNAGKIILGVAVLSLVLGALVVARKGRLWVSIVAIVLSAIGLVMGLASLAAPASDQKDLNATADAGFSATGLVKMGATLSTVGTGVLLVAAILAIAVRRRQA